MKKRQKTTESSIGPYDDSNRKPTNTTFDGLGLPAGLSLSGVSNKDVRDSLDECNNLSDAEKEKVSDELISMLLDTADYDRRSNRWKNQASQYPVGLRKALEQKVNELAEHWSTTIEKTIDVVWFSLRKAYRVLETGSAEETTALRQALSGIFHDTARQSLGGFLARTGNYLNDWNDGGKLRCINCRKKLKNCGTYGYSDQVAINRILRFNTCNDVGMPSIALPQQHLKCQDGDVLVRAIDPETKLPIESGDSWKVIKTGNAKTKTKLENPEEGWIHKDYMKLLFGECSCSHWITDWRPFTKIVEEAIKDTANVLPEKEILLSQLTKNKAKLSAKGKRVFSFIQRDLNNDSGKLETKLSTAFLDANSQEIQTALHNLIDTEQDGRELKAWTRVFTSLSAVRKINDNKLICQLLTRKCLKSLVKDIMKEYFVTDNHTSGFGWVWGLPSNCELNGQLLRCPFGWRRLPDSPIDSPPPVDCKTPLDLGDKLHKGEMDFAVCPILRGFDKLPGSYESLSKLDCPLIFISTDNPWAPFEPSIGGTLTRQLLASLFKRFRQVIILVGTQAWVNWWKNLLVPDDQDTEEPKTKRRRRKKKRQVLKFCLDAPAAETGSSLPIQILPSLLGKTEADQARGVEQDNEEPHTNKRRKRKRKCEEIKLPSDARTSHPIQILSSGQTLLEKNEANQARGVLEWYNYVNSFDQKKDDTKAKATHAKATDGVEETPLDEFLKKMEKGRKMTLIQFFHKFCGPLYPISVSDEALTAAQGIPASLVEPVTRSSKDQLSELSKPMEWCTNDEYQESPEGVHVYGDGHGVVVTHPDIDKYRDRFDEFISEETPFFDEALELLGDQESFEDVCKHFNKQFAGAPYTLARPPQDLDKENRIHLFLGQEYRDGITFANQVEGSGKPVRFTHRKAGLGDSQFATYDILPINQNWQYDLDYFVACQRCRPALLKEKNYGPKLTKSTLPDVPTSCSECKRRYDRILDWLCLMLAGMIRAVSCSGAKLFITPSGEVSRFIFNRLWDKAPEWMRGLELKTPNRDICHPNAVLFAPTENQIRRRRQDYGELFIELTKFRKEDKLIQNQIQRKEALPSFYAELEQVYEAFNPSILNVKRMKAVEEARRVITILVEEQVKMINKLIGVGESKEPIDLRSRLNRLISQIHLQYLATSPELANKINAIAATNEKKPTPVAAPKVASKSSGKLTRKVKRGFFDQCYHHLTDRLSQPNEQRWPLMIRLGLESFTLNGPAPNIQTDRAKGRKESIQKAYGKGWKQSIGKAFEKGVSALFAKWQQHPERLKTLIAHGPARLLDCFSAENGDNPFFILNEEAVDALLKDRPAPKPPKAKAKIAKKNGNSTSKPRTQEYCFVPKIPKVKIVFKPNLSIGMFLISGRVASEIIVDATRRVLEPENLRAMGLDEHIVNSDVPKAVIRAALLAAFKLQRKHFVKGVDGDPEKFIKGLDLMFKRKKKDNSYSCQGHSVASTDSGIANAFLLSLFDYRRVLAKSHNGTICARSDGRSLNMTGLLPNINKRGNNAKKAKKKLEKNPLEEKRGTFGRLAEDLQKEVELKLVDLDKFEKDTIKAAGKLDGREKSEVEVLRSELKAVQAELEAGGVLIMGMDCGKTGQNAVMAPLSIRQPVMDMARAEAELAKAKASGVKADIRKAKAKLKKATLSQDAAERLFRKAHKKPNKPPQYGSETGAHCVTVGLLESEMQERKLRKVLQELLAVFDECFHGESHHTMEKKLVDPNGVPFGEEFEIRALRSRLSVYRLLKIAYNSGAQRRQRRTRAIRRRRFVAQVTRLFTKVLPAAVVASPETFLEKSLPFPKRSPQSRQREKVCGGKRGVKRDMEAIPSSNSFSCRLPLCISVDMFSGKGQKTTSNFPHQELYRSMVRYIRSHPKLSKRVMVHINNGYRSSKAAAGTMCFLANLGRHDHRQVQAVDRPRNWKGALPKGFKYFYCPVTNTILKRDPPAALSMATIGACIYFGAHRPEIWAPAQTTGN